MCRAGFQSCCLLQVLTVDCANGVGAEKLKALTERLSGDLDVSLRSAGGGDLNDGCGADYVQKEKRFPAGMEDCQDGARSAAASQNSCLKGTAPMQSQTALSLHFLELCICLPERVPCMTPMVSKM